MTRVCYDRAALSLSMEGHAGAGEAGNDLVCAALSALMLTLEKRMQETAERTLRIVESIKAMIERYTTDAFLESVKGQKETMRDAVDLIFRKVYVRIKDLTDKGIHRQTASVYLDRFVDAGLLEKEKIGRDNIYKNVKLLALFENDGKE